MREAKGMLDKEIFDEIKRKTIKTMDELVRDQSTNTRET